MLKLNAIRKRFLNVVALDGVDLELRPGEIHALIGPNGAGKSTLMHILAGLLHPDEGSIELDGTNVQFKSVQDAGRHGIAMLHQDPVLVPDLSVCENIFLGAEPTIAGFIPRIGYMKAESRRLLKQLGYAVHPDTPVRSLTYSQQSIVAIAKALARKSRILIMDEPTSYLSGVESARLFDIMRRLREEGVTIVFISHRMKEVIDICDRVTVVRDGKHVLTSEVGAVTQEQLIRHMLGHSPQHWFPPILNSPGRALFEVRGLTQHPDFRDIHLKLHEGEILGIAGLVGSGKSELARALFAQARGNGGSLGSLGSLGNLLKSRNVRVGLVHSNRVEEGLFMELGVKSNLTISSLDVMEQRHLLNAEREVGAALDTVMDLDIKVEHLNQEVRFLSGGSQQKVALGKWLVSNCDLFLLDEPTRGIDLGSKGEMYATMHELVERGKGMIVFSSDVSELLGLCTRIAVMYEGAIVAELHHSEATEERIYALATGSEMV
ncbi:hypothetical protein SY83_11945 [Paenibacillus swuensis]|uniref:ABC transporter domain-containing protein n=1 Tax=Paenibacillus swuensis TaxID=1178515 RepID=A0A172TIH9_9BACL|nr:sugar ABC transporter ATP-binding protein [Paenibacillus swuensis]ANE46869.1 hypothetical protein SY83_11945 [Paenibacillus swuensis]